MVHFIIYSKDGLAVHNVYVFAEDCLYCMQFLSYALH